MSLIEQNFIAALKSIDEAIEKEKKENDIITGPITVRVAYNHDSYKLHSIALSLSRENANDLSPEEKIYYNMCFEIDTLDELAEKFKNKYLYHLAYSDIYFALYSAYKHALYTTNGEYTLRTSFTKKHIDDHVWAYNEVLEYSDLKSFGCWLNYDDSYEQVEIQADIDFIELFEKINPEEETRI